LPSPLFPFNHRVGGVRKRKLLNQPEYYTSESVKLMLKMIKCLSSSHATIQMLLPGVGGWEGAHQSGSAQGQDAATRHLILG